MAILSTSAGLTSVLGINQGTVSPAEGKSGSVSREFFLLFVTFLVVARWSAAFSSVVSSCIFGSMIQ
jgi:hypothetical protein